MYIYTILYIYVCVYIYVCIYKYVYIYIYVYILQYIYIIYIYTTILRMHTHTYKYFLSYRDILFNIEIF